MLGTTVSLLALLGAASADVYLYASKSRRRLDALIFFRGPFCDLSLSFFYVYSFLSGPFYFLRCLFSFRMQAQSAWLQQSSGREERCAVRRMLNLVVFVDLSCFAIEFLDFSIDFLRFIVCRANSTNANRLFNSQNNNRGGYNVGVRGATATGLKDLSADLTIDAADLTKMYHTPSQPTVRLCALQPRCYLFHSRVPPCVPSCYFCIVFSLHSLSLYLFSLSIYLSLSLSLSPSLSLSLSPSLSLFLSCSI